MKEELKASLKPLYAELLPKITTKKDICPFCLQWGSNFPKEKNSGILFVGKATNGWITTSRDPDTLFGDTCDRIFARHDQMKWVHNHEGNEHYNTRNSAYWRVIKKQPRPFTKTNPGIQRLHGAMCSKLVLGKGTPTPS